MIRRILLDIDDVLNGCTKYALQWLGVPMDYSRFYETYPTKHGYNIVATANELVGYERFSVPSFWNMIPRVFWATCPKSEQCDMILEECERLVGRDNICLLTGPTKDPDCLAGKLEWIHDFMPPWLHRQYLVGPRKQFCAHPESVLIDDSDANAEAFMAWGGHSLVVPRPWNHLSQAPTTEYVRQQFQRFHRFNDYCRGPQSFDTITCTY